MAIVLPIGYVEPAEIPYCGSCGHFHSVDDYCPDDSEDCGSFLCCHSVSDDSIDVE